ncbi:SMI1/KNR4 family protein [Hymenobacter cellulosilyticus]|uniref:SMI1/KNR4 family protein n=1 Tax=Hymenobacter cellulosilyticus TaxID=2932248 RepID=A0A8T9Q9Q9_9BACT|nr:SMI1/KNR4 family protein [Hymenobacter cellulosilyticus]UOQ72550.1 SMI1/KNR4 family protein [Hymenobacter cellulosilyticus]
MPLPTDFDAHDFWADSDYATKQHTEAPPTAELIARVETDLGYRLPAFYVALMRTRNGGIPRNTCFPTTEPTSWADDHIAITSISGIGYEKPYALCGGMGSQFMLEEWGYPAIGVVVCDCPSAGHDLIMLDYRACGPEGSQPWYTSIRKMSIGLRIWRPTLKRSFAGWGRNRHLRPNLAQAFDTFSSSIGRYMKYGPFLAALTLLAACRPDTPATESASAPPPTAAPEAAPANSTDTLRLPGGVVLQLQPSTAAAFDQLPASALPAIANDSTVEEKALATAQDRVRRQELNLMLKPDQGPEVQLASTPPAEFTLENGDGVRYQYWGSLPTAHQWVVQAWYWESSGVVLVDQRTGRRAELLGTPSAAPMAAYYCSPAPA